MGGMPEIRFRLKLGYNFFGITISALQNRLLVPYSLKANGTCWAAYLTPTRRLLASGTCQGFGFQEAVPESGPANRGLWRRIPNVTAVFADLKGSTDPVPPPGARCTAPAHATSSTGRHQGRQLHAASSLAILMRPLWAVKNFPKPTSLDSPG